MSCQEEGGMERLIVGLSYKGVVQKCLKKIKYQSQWSRLADLYGLCKFPRLRGVVTCVPMWRGKEKERGFNQAEILAKLLAKQYKIPYLVMLERRRETKPMFGLNKQERRENVEGAFAIVRGKKGGAEKLRRVILVDDVWTTGATMKECTRVLKNGGVKEVWGVTIAR
ncbi:MAG: phosphoribosyltransferase family protein [bacterium]